MQPSRFSKGRNTRWKKATPSRAIEPIDSSRDPLADSRPTKKRAYELSSDEDQDESLFVRSPIANKTKSISQPEQRTSKRAKHTSFSQPQPISKSVMTRTQPKATSKAVGKGTQPETILSTPVTVSRPLSIDTTISVPISDHKSPKKTAVAPNLPRTPDETGFVPIAKFTTLQKTEVEAFRELDLFARQHFIAFLDNQRINDPIMQVFPGIKETSEVFKTAKTKVMNSYKTWKNRIIDSADRWIARRVKGTYMEKITNFKDLKQAIAVDYQDHWLEDVLRFALEAVDFKDCTENGHCFLRYAFIYLVVHTRMTTLHYENRLNTAVIKYDRQHLLDVFDAFHRKSEFFGTITLSDFPMRKTGQIKRVKQYHLDLNKDSDAEVDESPDHRRNRSDTLTGDEDVQFGDPIEVSDDLEEENEDERQEE